MHQGLLLEKFYFRNKKENGNQLCLSRTIQAAKRNYEIYVKNQGP